MFKACLLRKLEARGLQGCYLRFLSSQRGMIVDCSHHAGPHPIDRAEEENVLNAQILNQSGHTTIVGGAAPVACPRMHFPLGEGLPGPRVWDSCSVIVAILLKLPTPRRPHTTQGRSEQWGRSEPWRVPLMVFGRVQPKKQQGSSKG